MSKNIVTALEYLPEELISEAIVEAAVATQNITVLNYLPEKYLTPENIDFVIQKEQSYWLADFDLSRIPEAYRTKAVCHRAISHCVGNLKHVPSIHIDREMVEKLMSDIDKHLQSAKYVPAELWDSELAYKGVSRLYSCSPYQHKRDDAGFIKLQVFISFIPAAMKNREFYLGMLDNTNVGVDNLLIITPNKYKCREYYLKIAEYKPELVPLKYFDYELLMSAFAKPDSCNMEFIFKNSDVREIVQRVIDTKMADAIIKQCPDNFNKLPKRYQTSKRLALAFDSSPSRCRSLSYTVSYNFTHLLNTHVCKAMVRKQCVEPAYPKEIWTQEFVDYCIEQAPDYEWFRIMPEKFQTQQMVDNALRAWRWNAQYCRARFITRDISKNLFRIDEGFKKHIPRHHFTEFVNSTGLAEEFFGGELSLLRLKTERKSHTYTKIGNTYIGFYKVGKYNDEQTRLVMTRATSRYEKPEKVFDVVIGTYHKTWLEKLVADNDPEFEKPKADKSLKDVQAVCYYGVEHYSHEDNGTEVYRNTFMGQTMGYCAKREGWTYHCDRLEDVIQGLENKINGIETPPTAKGDNVVLTAAWLHKEYGFCELGMGTFALDYNLDINAEYTVGQLRQIIAEKGVRPSVERFRRELKRIEVI